MSRTLEDFRSEGALHNPDISSVITTAHVVKAQVAAMGGNDSEFDSIDAIVLKARKGFLDNTEAIMQIEYIRDNKHGNGGHGLQG